jgi:hypothetical protein
LRFTKARTSVTACGSVRKSKAPPALWHSDILRLKLMVLVLVAVLLALHVLSPSSRVVSYAVAAASLLVFWLGVNSRTADAPT